MPGASGQTRLNATLIAANVVGQMPWTVQVGGG